VDDKVMERITSLQSEGVNLEVIAGRVSRESKLSPAMVRYMIKQTA
jgi:hypothetical protein